MVNCKNKNAASLSQWHSSIESGHFDREFGRIYGVDQIAAWRTHYLGALEKFAEIHGNAGEVVVARCPGQMNVMGMHIDYGGMPSLRLAVRGADTLVVARAAPESRKVRISSVLHASGDAEDRFAPIELDLDEILPTERVVERQALMDYAGRICQERLVTEGSALADDWSVLIAGQLVYLESYFRDRLALYGFDALVWSSVSPSGGMSSSSALVVATALATLGVHGLEPHRDILTEDLIDGLGTSEWIRGTRGGTADHGGMILGRSGRLISVGVFPAWAQGEAVLPDEYAALVLDSGIVREYDEAVKEETVIAYPLGTFIARELILPRLKDDPNFAGLVGDFRERIHFIRDLTVENLGLSLSALYRILGEMPKRTSLAELEAECRAAGIGGRFDEWYQREIAGKFQFLTDDTALFVRRRCAFGLAEQDRVDGMIEYLNAGDMPAAFELIRISHEGDLDAEVEDEVLADLVARVDRGEQRAGLRFLPGGYGRMTPPYDRLVRLANDFLVGCGATVGSVQRLGAGWGGNIGGLIHRDFIDSERGREFVDRLSSVIGHEPEMAMIAAGEGAVLLLAPQEY